MNPLFTSYKLNPVGFEKAKAISLLFHELLLELSLRCPESREMSLAKTHLENACFFAKKAMATDKTNQEPAGDE